MLVTSSKTSKSYMLDSNVFDRLIDGNIDLRDIGVGVFLSTAIQQEELRRTPDMKGSRRSELLKRFDLVVERVVPASSFCLDIAGAGLEEATWGDGSGLAERLEIRIRELDKLQGKGRKPKDANPIRDSIIAETAAKHGAILVTSDANLAQAFEEEGYRALHFPRPPE